MRETEGDVAAVVVTYGARRHLLQDVLAALEVEAPTRVVVVDNGCSWNVKQELSAAHGDWVNVVDMGQNTGSAPAYAAGVRRAAELGARWIWLLDDDNKPCFGSLALLRGAHARFFDPSNPFFAVAAIRPIGLLDVPAKHWSPRHSAFCGFHLLDIPRKLGRRIGRRQPASLPTDPTPVEVSAYGGMFFAAPLVEAIGLPRNDFVLYCDDYEWSSRITTAGGRILVVPQATVTDLGVTWGSAKGNHVRSLLDGGKDSLAYYAARNEAYFFAHHWRRSRLEYLLNAIIFRTLLWSLSWARGRRKRYRILRRAMREGHAGKLGMRPEFPL